MNKIKLYDETRSGLMEHEFGDYVKVEDLIQWLHNHVRNGNISTVYSDLFKALGEVNTVKGISDKGDSQ